MRREQRPFISGQTCSSCPTGFTILRAVVRSQAPLSRHHATANGAVASMEPTYCRGDGESKSWVSVVMEWADRYGLLQFLSRPEPGCQRSERLLPARQFKDQKLCKSLSLQSLIFGPNTGDTRAVLRTPGSLRVRN